LNDCKKLLYKHLSFLFDDVKATSARAKKCAKDKIYMSQDYEKCLKHTVVHQSYVIGAYEDVYLHFLDASVANERYECFSDIMFIRGLRTI
jgi:hypothetical protein